MDDRRPGDVPRLWREQPPLPSYPQDVLSPSSPPELSQWDDPPYTWRDWLTNLSPGQQLGYGCILVVVMSTLFLYCVGASTFFVRRMLLGRVVPTPTAFIPPTLAPTPTQVPPPTFIIPLPTARGPLAATPTQAPLPTLAPPTATATYDPYAPTPTRKPTTAATYDPSALTPTRKPTARP
jgi:hypothetical protein